jgi:hypothetical protein
MEIEREPLAELPLRNSISSALSHSALLSSPSTGIPGNPQVDEIENSTSKPKRARISKFEDFHVKARDISARIQFIFPKEDVLGKVRTKMPKV